MSGYLEAVLARVGQQHGLALEWFEAQAGTTDRLPWRRGGQSAVDGLTIALVAQRGIHQPAGWDMALSVTVSGNGQYFDDKPRPLGDGTWVLLYRAHSGQDGSGSDSRWNRALMSNIERDIPVGVFVHSAGAEYINMGLARVERYFRDQDTFLLRGSVEFGQSNELWDRQGDSPWELISMETELPDSAVKRRQADVVQRERQSQFRRSLLDAYAGACAITACNAEPALQAAHIVEYNGVSGQRASNGLLLRADVHLLYDRHLISVNPDDYRVWLSARLRSTSYSELHKTQLRLPLNPASVPDRDRLALHWDVFTVNS